MERAHRPGDAARCLAHFNRNPCAIEGCKRSTRAPWREIGEHGASAPWLALDQWFCGDHWRALIPPRSVERRIYLRFWRRARRFGWNDQSSGAFWRIWARIVAIARARAAGDIDEAEIRRMFGWGKDAAA